MNDLYQLPSVTLAAGVTTNIPLRDLPQKRRGRIPHVKNFLFDTDVAPAFTTAPTTVGLNEGALKTMEFSDGSMLRFIGGFNYIRQYERFNTGKLRLADADNDGATGTVRHFRRSLHMGPPQSIDPSDWYVPAAMLAGGELRMTQGQLTDYSSDTTAITGTTRVYAHFELQDQVNIPPALNVQAYSIAGADATIPGRCLLLNLWGLDSSAFGAFAAGEIGNVNLDMGAGLVLQSVPAAALTEQYHDDFATGETSGFTGAPATATDDNIKNVNRATPTAVAAAPFDLQPYIWLKPRGKVTKQELAETNIRLYWSGTQATQVVVAARILSQPQNVIGARLSQIFGTLGVKPGAASIKTESKKPYVGPYVEFMPWTVKVARG